MARTRHRGRILLLLAAALVCVQLLGLMHAVLHEHARSHVAAGAAPAAAKSAADHGGFGSLFSGHDSQADCDHFDHITHADLAAFDAPAVAMTRAEGIAVARHASWHIAQQATGFLARGPPSQA